MKLKLSKQQLNGLPPAQWLRRAGYAFIVDHQSGQESFARRFTRDFYPRFHLYVQELAGGDDLFFNLHLDHKKASYAGQTRHSADYEGELVETEVARLQALLGQPNLAASHTIRQSDNVKATAAPLRVADGDVLNRLPQPSLQAIIPTVPKKNWWQKLFS